jgi:hypothetical protein
VKKRLIFILALFTILTMLCFPEYVRADTELDSNLVINGDASADFTWWIMDSGHDHWNIYSDGFDFFAGDRLEHAGTIHQDISIIGLNEQINSGTVKLSLTGKLLFTTENDSAKMKVELFNSLGDVLHSQEIAPETNSDDYVNKKIDIKPVNPGTTIIRISLIAQLGTQGNSECAFDDISLILADYNPPNPPSVTGTTPTNDLTPTWSWSSTGGGIGTYRYKLDSDDFTEITFTSFTPSIPLSDGIHTLYVQEINAAGDWSASGSFPIVIDTQAPTVTLDSTAAEPTNISPIPVKISFSEDVTGFDENDIVVGNGTIVTGSFSGSGASYTVDIIPSDQGTVTVDIAASMAVDAVGNGNIVAPRFSRTYDSIAPTGGSVSINGGAAYTNSRTVTLTLSATGASEMIISENAGFTGAAYEAYSTSKSFELSAENGIKTVYVQYKDAAGNKTTEEISDTIILDTQAPTVTLSSTAAEPTNISPIPVKISFSEDVTGFDENDIVVGNGTIVTGSFSGSGASYTVDIIPSDQGTVTVDIAASMAVDAVGNGNIVAPRFSRTYDSIAPTGGSVSINGGAAYTNSRTVTLTLSATGASEMIISENAGFTGAAYEAYSTSKSFELSAENGIKTVYVQYKDAAGNKTTEEISDTIILDTQAPTVTLSSTAAEPTNISPIPVKISFSEDVTGFDENDIVVGNGTIVTGSFNGSGASYTVDIIPSGQGAVTVNIGAGVCADAAGNDNAKASQLSRTYDNVAPTVMLSSTASNPTNVSPIPVTISFNELVTGFDVSDIVVGNGTTDSFSGAGANYAVDILPSTQGAITVDIPGRAAQDAAGNGNTAATQLILIYDTEATTGGGISINGDAVYTNSRAVTLTLSAADASEMMISEDRDFSDASYEPYAASRDFELSPGDGIKKVYVKFKDAAGNETTGEISDTIILDTHRPEVSLSTSMPNPTNVSPIPVAITFSEPVRDFDESDIVVGNGITDSFGGTEANYTVNISATTQGAITVNVDEGICTDEAGNPNIAAAQLILIYDTEATTGGSISINGGAAYTNSREVTLTLSAADALKMMISEDRDFGGASYEDYSSTKDFELSPGNGIKKVYVKYMDAAGNETTVEISDTIILDTLAPTVSLSSPTANPTNVSPIPVTITFSEAVTDFDIDDLTVGNGSKSNFTRVDGTTYTVDITPGEGDVTVDIAEGAARDEAGNVNAAALQLSRTFDGQPPVLAGLNPATGTANVGLNDNLVIVFSENILKGTGAIVIKKASDGSIVETIDVAGADVVLNGATATINPSAALSFGTAYFVQIGGNAFKDAAGNYYNGIIDDSWSFTTVVPSSDADLSALSISSGTLTFAAGKTLYTVNVPYNVFSIIVTATASGQYATLTVNGAAIASGQASAPISLAAGASTAVSIVVTAQDGTTTKTYTINVTRAAASGGSSGGGGSTSPAPVPKDEASDKIIVDDKNGISNRETTTENGRMVTTVTVNERKLEEELKARGSNATVVIPVNSGSDVVVGQLSGQTVKNMENKEAVLEINTGSVSYTLPASELNISDIAGQFGGQIELSDIKVSVRIAEAPQDTVRIVRDTADENNYQVVVDPIDFEITCSSGDRTVSISKFNGYVERTVAIPDGIDPSKITTGIVLNSDGTFSHAPTTIIMINGRYYAKINSLTNSTYSVIWNPRTLRDVEKHWARDDVNDMVSRLVMEGIDKDNFAPDRGITRAEFAAAAVKALGLFRPGTGKPVFSDVDKEDSYYDAVSIAYENGLVAGYGKNIFKPEEKITREEAMAILTRAMKIAGLNTKASGEEIGKQLGKYKDGGKVSSWAREAVAVCLRNEIMAGYNGQLTPKENITRAQTASVVKRLLKKAALI